MTVNFILQNLSLKKHTALQMHTFSHTLAIYTLTIPHHFFFPYGKTFSEMIFWLSASMFFALSQITVLYLLFCYLVQMDSRTTVTLCTNLLARNNGERRPVSLTILQNSQSVPWESFVSAFQNCSKRNSLRDQPTFSVSSDKIYRLAVRLRRWFQITIWNSDFCPIP